MPREIPATDLSLTGWNLTQTHTHGNEGWEGEVKGRSRAGESRRGGRSKGSQGRRSDSRIREMKGDGK